ncbi:hypothetical protein DFP73DRAFT_536001 [Morchella snyderi]|nr:hypothetical protein DFP73DRAFT_536001 [Morchella snyderi]
MSLFTTLLTVALALSTAVSGTPVKKRSPKIIFDGRIPVKARLADLDSASASPFNAEYVLGAGQKWSDVAEFPRVETSLYDLRSRSKAIEVTINDDSIFAPGGNPQPGFRRSELLPKPNNGTDATVSGHTTFHFSIKDDPHRPLNYSHQYELVFIETNDYSSHVWTLKTGSAYGAATLPAPNARTLRLGGSTAGGAAEEPLFSVPFRRGGPWHNFAVETDWDKSTIAVYYSADYAPLRKVVETRANDATGKGQAHIGILKLPTGPSSDVAHEGYQSPNLNEGLVYGGIFVEDNASRKPNYCRPRA